MTLVLHRTDFGNESYSHEHVAASISPRLQELIILPTEKCNFRCTYCYEDFQIGKMSETVQKSIENYLDRRVPELVALNFQWFGGEPLVARAIVLRLAAHAARLCKLHDVALNGALTTNGYLLDRALFEELLTYNQRTFQITLDGPREVHDVVRKQANGRGSFDRIWSNLLATRDVDERFTITLRIHVRRENLEALESFMPELADAFGDDPRYKLDFQHLRDLGGEGGKTVTRPLTLAELREIEIGLRSIYDDTLIRRGASGTGFLLEQQSIAATCAEGAPANAVHHPADICYAAKPNSLLIRADGRIGKCTVALTDDRNTIGGINPDGTVSIDSGRLRPWIRGLATLDRAELECPLGGLPAAV